MVSVRLSSLALFAAVSCSGPAGAPQSGAASPATSVPRDPPIDRPVEPTVKSPDLEKEKAPPKEEIDDRRDAGILSEDKSPESPKLLVAPVTGARNSEPGGAPMAATTRSLSGRLNEAEVGQVVSEGIDAFATCTRIDASVSLSLNIDAEGRVGEAVAARSEPDDAKMRDCVVRAVKTLKFPRSTDGRGSPVRFELRLTPKP